MRWFANHFHEWSSHVWTSLANRLMHDQKVVINCKPHIILLRTSYFMLYSSIFTNNGLFSLNNQMSHKCEAQALWHHLCQKLFLLLQIDAKLIFNYEYYHWLPIPCHPIFTLQKAVSIRKTVLPGMAIPMLKIRRPNGRFIFNMEIAIRR